MVSFEQVAQNLTEDVYYALRQSLQLGKWPDGRPLSSEQKEICMDAIITYELTNNVPEPDRVGYLDRDRPTPCAENSGRGPTSGIWTPEG